MAALNMDSVKWKRAERDCDDDRDDDDNNNATQKKKRH
jgi:hypothetical protein